MRSPKTEIRKGFFSPERRRTIACNAVCFYFDYILGRQSVGAEHARDHVVLVVKYATADYGVDRGTIKAWLDELIAQDLIWYHRLQHAICIHIVKPGYHSNNVWIPIPETHGERRSDAGKTQHLEISDAGNSQHLDGSDAGNSPHPDAGNSQHLEPSLYLASKNLPQESSSGGAAAPRAPDGARVGAPPELETLLMEAVAAGDERQVRYLQERIAARDHRGRRRPREVGDDGPTSVG